MLSIPKVSLEPLTNVFLLLLPLIIYTSKNHTQMLTTSQSLASLALEKPLDLGFTSHM